ncbi:recombinase family protein [Salipiger sp. P9]|uniref:recombinase family protein n=1 Tax=Salipiger pentaromativorans TaxID=2943193 RepID=UPI0021588340|nr:recombinase family protein [Salipiger pentaromativorans]MCR8551169.1 recombinase family protein [Salipiger pentaromativorans]
MKPCFGYIRVSTVRQGEGASLEAQKDAITGFASQNNLTIIKWFEERETASKIGRPVFGQMMQALQMGEAEGLIVHKIDRWARNYKDWALVDEAAQIGVNVYSAADSLDLDTRGGRLLADIQMALAADYSRNLSQEVKKGLYGRIKQGLYPFRAPLGYLDTGGGNVKTIDPLKGPLVRTAFTLYSSGEYSITSLTEEMRRRGLKGYGEGLVVRRNIESLLANPFYCGQMRVAGKLYPGAHEPLVSARLYRRVQLIKADRTAKKETRHKLLFRRLVRCGACGGILTGELQKSHIYYRCHTSGCGRGKIRQDRLDEQIVATLARLQISAADRATIAEKIATWVAGDGQDEIEKTLRLRIADAVGREERLTDLLVDGSIDRAAYELRKQNLGFELQQLREELQEFEASRSSQHDFEDALRLATELPLLYRAAPPTQRRALLRNCLCDLTARDGIFAATPTDWLHELREMAADPSRLPVPARSTMWGEVGKNFMGEV